MAYQSYHSLGPSLQWHLHCVSNCENRLWFDKVTLSLGGNFLTHSVVTNYWQNTSL